MSRFAHEVRRLAVRGLAVLAALLTVIVGVPALEAWAGPPASDIEETVKKGDLIRDRLGNAFGGYWVDEDDGSLIVGVTNPALATAVRVLGGVPQVVGRSAAALDDTKAKLDARAATAPDSVTGWYVDVRTNEVVVSVLGDDPAAAEFIAASGEAVRVEQVDEAPRPLWNIIGGQAITRSAGRCSAGFNARSAAGVRYLLTAGHCTNGSSTWSGAGGTIGTVAGTSFPTNDFGVIRVTSSSAASTALVDRYSSGSDVTVAGSTVVPVGAAVCRSGSTTAWRCGSVTATNQTVNYGSGSTVAGLTRTNACAEPGDSGGSFVSKPTSTSTKVQAQGLLSGGSGSCTLGGTTFFQPVKEALSTYGLSLYVG